MISGLLEKILSGKSWKEILDDYLIYAQAGTRVEIPGAGLENVKLGTSMPVPSQKPPVVRDRKSRPKLPAEGNNP